MQSTTSKKMGGIIMIASIIIWFLGYYPNHDAYETVAEQQENSYIGQLGRGIEPQTILQSDKQQMIQAKLMPLYSRQQKAPISNYPIPVC